ncbi:MAG: acetate--CoA ligase family protein [Syntrophales bacterium]|nr:acetate--CoA ligase family protein [Syntrophales bacterium]
MSTYFETIEKAKKENRFTLNEEESKKIISAYGIPVVESIIVHTPQETFSLAEQLPFPVVVKGLGATLTHKTERKLVKLNLHTPEEVFLAAKEIAFLAGNELEGFTIQPQIQGKREFVAGAFYDRQFGPVVMFGLGGILTEAIQDVAFRIAPIDEREAFSMIEDIRSKVLLGEFRGDEPVNKEEIAKTLIGLSRLITEQTDILEVDVNPLIVSSDGRIKAADALVVLGERKSKKERSYRVSSKDLFKIFYPRSIAFIGASEKIGKWGHRLFATVVKGGYAGKIFLVNPKGGYIGGHRVYPSILDLPESVDLGVVTVPASSVRGLLPALKEKRIKYLLIISSGFSETSIEGKLEEKKLVEEALKADIIFVGPNTMGIANPHNKFYCLGVGTWPKPGSITLVAQSGNLGLQLLCFAEREGIGIRAFCGSGNEAMITVEDYMRILGEDETTNTVTLYIESIKNGQTFLEAAKLLTRKKPVILLKGGRTEAGSRAAASHTGAMAANQRIFEGACRQAGIILTKNTTELLDLAAAFSSLPLPKGNHVGIVTLGGGWGVVASDLCAENGLAIPSLPPNILEDLDKLLPPYWSHTNPVDLVGEPDPYLPLAVMEILAAWEGCDAIIHLGTLGRVLLTKSMVEAVKMADATIDKRILDKLIENDREAEMHLHRETCRLMEKYEKPIIGVYIIVEEGSRIVNEVPGYTFKSIVLPTPERAVYTLAKMVEYKNFLSLENRKDR